MTKKTTLSLSQKTTLADYEAVAEMYIADFEKEQRHFDFIDAGIKLVSKTNLSHLPVVDLGSGPGNVTDYLLKKSKLAIEAVDFSPKFIAFLNQKYQANSRVKVINAEAIAYLRTQLTASKSAIIDSFCLYHFEPIEVDLALTEIYRTLAKGGVLIMAAWEGKKSGFEQEPYQVQKDPRLKVTERLQTYVNFFTKPQLEGIFTKIGFNVIQVKVFTETAKPGEFNTPFIWSLVQKPI